MTSYSAHLRQNDGSGGSTLVRPTITRRPGLEAPAAPPAAAVAVGQNSDLPLSEPAAGSGEFDLNLDLEVPAFLRRNEG